MTKALSVLRMLGKDFPPRIREAGKRIYNALISIKREVNHIEVHFPGIRFQIFDLLPYGRIKKALVVLPVKQAVFFG